jgi:hypothetical protein
MSDLKYPEYWLTSSATSTISLQNNTYGTYLGKATGAYTNIILNYIIITVTSGVTWSEIAIYKGTPSLNTAASLTRVNWVSQAQTWTSGASVNKITTIPCNGLVQPGDDLWVVIGGNGGTGPAIRGPNIADDIGAGFIQTFSNNRPSTNATLTGTVSTTLNGLTIFWMGI